MAQKGVKVTGTFPPRLRSLIAEYRKRFKSHLPMHVYRLVSAGQLSTSQLQSRVSRALLAGHPDKDWEAELSLARETPEAERSLQQQMDVEPFTEVLMSKTMAKKLVESPQKSTAPPLVKPGVMPPGKLKEFAKNAAEAMMDNLNAGKKPPKR